MWGTVEWMAKRMLDVEDLPEALVKRLVRVNELCERVSNGRLASRQAVAVIIEQWERDQAASQRVNEVLNVLDKQGDEG